MNDGARSAKFFLDHNLRPTPNSSKNIWSEAKVVLDSGDRNADLPILNAKAHPSQVLPDSPQNESEETSQKGAFAAANNPRADIHEQAGPAFSPSKHDGESYCKRLGVAITAAWKCFWRVLNRV